LLHLRKIFGRLSEATALTAMERSEEQSKFQKNSIYHSGSDVQEEIDGLILDWVEIYLKWIITTVRCAGVL
jgi:hypothetical protein